MKTKFLTCTSPLGSHRVSYIVWGKRSNDIPVICVHGLTGNGHAFDPLAKALQNERQVYCPDIVGRGKSDRLSADPSLYSYPQYVADMTALLRRIGAPQVDWVGTSMGGIIGMMLAARPDSPIRRLVLNDVGPFISLESIKRIADYVGNKTTFADLPEAELYMREIYAPFGKLSDKDWRHLARHGTRALPDGKLTMAYDPAISVNFKAAAKDLDLWNLYEQIICPVLVLNGEKSDILSKATAEQMTKRGPKATLVTVAGVGHAPALMDKGQIDLVVAFLKKGCLSRIERTAATASR
jgi:pimeloyl-ACP methyl ester carboxylesterase